MFTPDLTFQRDRSLISLVVKFHSCTRVFDMARGVVEQLVRSPIKSVYGIKISLEKLLRNHTCLNSMRPAILR